jgi:hypothetical protein
MNRHRCGAASRRVDAENAKKEKEKCLTFFLLLYEKPKKRVYCGAVLY